MDQENSNDVRPAEQIAPQQTPTPIDPEEYFIIKIPKRKVYRFIKIFLIIMFILSLWMNSAFMHAMRRGRSDMSIRMSFPRCPQFEMNRGGRSYKVNPYRIYVPDRPDIPDAPDIDNWDTYYFENERDYNGYFSGDFRMPSR